MKFNLVCTICTFLLTSTLLCARIVDKKPLNHSVYDSWKDLSRPLISNNGQWVSYEINPQKGDGYIYFINLISGKHDSISRGQEGVFSNTSDLIAFKIKPSENILRKLKLAKTKKEEMPKDSLGIFLIPKDSLIKIPGLKSFQVPKEGGSWISYLIEQPKDKDQPKTEKNDSTIKAKNQEGVAPKGSEAAKLKDNKQKKGAFNEVETSQLQILNPLTGSKYIFDHVTEASFSKNGRLCSFITLKKDSTDSTSVQIFDTQNFQVRKLFERAGLAKKAVPDDSGQQMAFIFTGDTTKVKRYNLYLWNEKISKPLKIADTSTVGIPMNWEISENGKLSFSDDGSKLYFGTAPKILQQPKDTLLDEEKSRLDIWNWKDDRLQSQQLKELEVDLKQSYNAVYRIPDQRILQLADSLIRQIRTIKKGNGEIAIGYSDLPYEKLKSWEESTYRDIYVVDLNNGNKKQVLTKKAFTTDLSPDGKYIYWYEGHDKAWYCMDLIKLQPKCLTCNLPVSFFDEKYDMPSIPGPYGIAGWTKEDNSIIIYDRYDLWQCDPKGIKSPVNLTRTGRKDKVSYRYINIYPEELSIDPEKSLLLKCVNEETCQQGFARFNLKTPGARTFLKKSDFDYSTPILAKNSKKMIWQRSSYKVYPDLWSSNPDFSNELCLSNTNPQQSGYLWGDVEQFRWTSLDGKEMKGLLYKPENFDPSHRYPMIVYYYERYSDKLNVHYVPSPTRSTVNFPYYNSNGYVVFVPDITYGTGQPGKDAYNSIMGGVLELIKRPYIDSKNMGLQGQSWGGYQTAYMVTQTGLFKAAMAGAPVSNMTSAYGGIRWESGMVRQFQYEHSQSRIGGTLWDKRQLYIDNSPIFFVDKITTPILIMSNDNDGAVPWYQGLEFFTALRRLGKQAWLLCYNGEEHNLTKRPNRQDLSIRMSQFFDHFLKGTPEPEWMKSGIPAIKKGKNLGY